jgi:hypothetical protein
MKTYDGTKAATVADVIRELQYALDAGQIEATDIFVTSSDPEGNSFVAFTPDDIIAGRSGVIEERGRYTLVPGSGTSTVSIAMAMFEIDPEEWS